MVDPLDCSTLHAPCVRNYISCTEYDILTSDGGGCRGDMRCYPSKNVKKGT